MSVAPYPPVTRKSSRSRRAFSGASNPTRRGQQPPSGAKNRESIQTLPTAQKRLPASLQFLLLLQQASSAITFSLIVVALGFYGWTVYAPKQWSQEYRKLETLQRYERHLTATNETLKNQLAQQAEKPGSGLAAPHPSQNIYLNSTNNSSVEQSVPSSPEPTQTQPILDTAASY